MITRRNFGKRMLVPLAAATALAVMAACGGTDSTSTEDETDSAAGSTPEDAVAEFYEGKTITILVGFVGGGYDEYARLLADHWSRFIPGNPDIIVENQEGGHGTVVMNRAYNEGPHDGTLIVVPNRAAYQHVLMQEPGVNYDLLEMPPIGNPIVDSGIFVAHERTGIESLEQLFDEELVVGVFPPPREALVLRDILGMKLDVVPGYEGGDAVNLAIEQGEVDSRIQWSISSMLGSDPAFVEQMNLLVQFTKEPHPLVPEGVPTIFEFVDENDQSQVDLFNLVFGAGDLGRPFYFPPNVPEERLEALRESFMAMMEDEEFLADAESRNMPIIPSSGEVLEEMIGEFMKASPETVEVLKSFSTS